MPYCSRCGVEVDDFVEKCPLCGTPIQKFSTDSDVTPSPYPEGHVEAVKPSDDKHNRYLAWMIFTVVLFTPFFVILTLGIQMKGMQTWAIYPLSSLVASWFCISFLLFFIKKPFVFSTGILVTIGALLLVFDAFDGQLTWFLPVGLPLLLLFYVLALAVILVSVRISEKGWNIAGFILLASGVFCGGMDVLINHFNHQKWTPTWSLIVVSAFFPLAAFFLLLHYLLKKKIKIKRFLHF